MKSIVRLIFGTLPPILIGAAAIAWFIANKQPPKQLPVAEDMAHVRIIAVKPTRIVPKVVGYGVVRPAKTWNGISQVGGKVIYVHPDFRKGASMAAETVVVRLSPSDYNLAVAQSEANIRSSRARLKELAVNEENTRKSLKIEEQALALKQDDLERKEALLKRGSVAQNTVDNARSAHLAQRQKVLGMQNTLNLMPTQRAVQEEQIAVYQSSLGTAKLNLERTSIKLPFTARVAETKTEISQYLVPGQSIGTFDGVENAEIEAQIPIQQFGAMLAAAVTGNSNIEPSLANFSKIIESYGLKARVRLKFGDTFISWNGAVSRISDTIDPKTRTVGIIVTVADAYLSAKPGIRPPLTKGMFVEVAVLGAAGEDALVVPRSALHNGLVYVANKNNRLEIRRVELSLKQDDIAVVSKGLSAGDKIVVSAVAPAVPGMLLKMSTDTRLEQLIENQAGSSGDIR